MIKVDKRSKDSVYITIGKWVIYIDNSTGEHIIESWKDETWILHVGDDMDTRTN